MTRSERFAARVALAALVGVALVASALELRAEHSDAACIAAWRATVDRLEGVDVPLADAATDPYEIPECHAAAAGGAP